MSFPPILTLGQASKALGVSKTTISNRIKKGELPYNGNPKDGYKIQLADLQQRYTNEWDKAQRERAEQSSNGQDNRQDLPIVTPQIDPNLQALTNAHEETVKALREMMDEKVSNRDEQIQHWKDEHQKAVNLRLTDQRTLDEKTADADRFKEELEEAKQAKIDIELIPKPVVKERRLTLKERIFGGEISVVEEVA